MPGVKIGVIVWIGEVATVVVTTGLKLIVVPLSKGGCTTVVTTPEVKVGTLVTVTAFRSAVSSGAAFPVVGSITLLPLKSRSARVRGGTGTIRGFGPANGLPGSGITGPNMSGRTIGPGNGRVGAGRFRFLIGSGNSAVGVAAATPGRESVNATSATEMDLSVTTLPAAMPCTLSFEIAIPP
jgi:hypothetical protein